MVRREAALVVVVTGNRSLLDDEIFAIIV